MLKSTPRSKQVRLLTTYKSPNDYIYGPADAFEAVKILNSEHDIHHLDVVIANAGIAYVYPKVSELKITDLKAHMEPNVHGAIWLYQATLPLLLRSANPKWVTMGSTAGILS